MSGSAPVLPLYSSREAGPVYPVTLDPRRPCAWTVWGGIFKNIDSTCFHNNIVLHKNVKANIICEKN